MNISDKMSFSEALETALSRTRQSIGTYKEKTLHHTLKLYYGGLHSTEVAIGKYVADVVREDGIYEIQSKAFYRIKEKLKEFLSVSTVTVVFPVSEAKYISWVDVANGEVVSRVKSPKKGSVYNILPELYSLRDLLGNEKLRFVIAIVNSEEYRYADGYGKDKKKRATKVDIVPSVLKEEIFIREPEDYNIFLPEDLSENFTSADFAKATKLPLKDASKAILVLTSLGLISKIGNKGKSNLYAK